MKSLTSWLIHRTGVFGLSIRGKKESEEQPPSRVYQLQAVLGAAEQSQLPGFWALSIADQISAQFYFIFF